MLKKVLMTAFMTVAVVGVVLLEKSPIFYKTSVSANGLNYSYNEEVVDDTESSIQNSELTSSTKKKTAKKTTTKKVTENVKTKSVSKIKDSVEVQNSEVQNSVDTSSKNSTLASSKSTTSTKTSSSIQSVSETEEPTPTTTTTKKTTKVQSTTKTTTTKKSVPTIKYDRTTSIYSDGYDKLIRVEYYLNNKLVYYSSVEKYDKATKSYIEEIYQWNDEMDVEILIRTDVYSNGKLVNSY